MNIQHKKEILFYYESRANPNGDPNFENQPRTMSDNTLFVTDVRIKRTIRDHAKYKLNKTLFVDDGADGKAVAADKKAEEIIKKDFKKNKEIDIISELMQKTFDVPLFGALVPIHSAKNNDRGDHAKLTGPVQFGIGRSVNKVNIINPSIVGRFEGRSGTEHSTIGRYSFVEYALIKIHGIVSPFNLGKYKDDSVVSIFSDNESLLLECLWDGTNGLVSRSKFPQRSVLCIEVEYIEKTYNDLPFLISEDDKMKKNPKELAANTFNFTTLVNTLTKRKNEIANVKIRCCEEIIPSVDELKDKLHKAGISVDKF